MRRQMDRLFHSLLLDHHHRDALQFRGLPRCTQLHNHGCRRSGVLGRIGRSVGQFRDQLRPAFPPESGGGG